MAEETKIEGLQEPSYVEELLSANEKLKSQVATLNDSIVKIQADNKSLVEKVLNGGNIVVEEDKTTIQEYCEKLYGDHKEDLNDLQYIDLTCKLRRKFMAEYGRDPFVGHGTNYTPSDNEEEKAANVAAVFEECVEYANGDNQLFLQELQRRTVDIPIPLKHNRR